MLQQEYYILESTQESCLFSWDQKSGSLGMGQPVQIDEPIKIRVGQPISEHPQFVDFHEMPDPVFSKRIVEVLAPMHLYGIQLLPAKVRNPNGGPFDEPRHYWFMHVWNSIACLDIDDSEVDLYDDGNIFSIEKLVLDEKALENIEFKQRQIFELAEKPSVLLIHQSVKDTILSVNPIGCRFFKATEWNSDIVFD
ncbi:MAG: DUF1629 domain-containing protein [Pseudomonadota bacterium]